MAKEFPLYDQLVANAPQELPDMSKLSGLINNGISNGSIIMAIIIHHAIITGQYSSGKIPYGGKTIDSTRGVFMRIQDLPNDLKKILWLYVSGGAK
jgi:hypothetical protein